LEIFIHEALEKECPVPDLTQKEEESISDSKQQMCHPNRQAPRSCISPMFLTHTATPT